MTVYDIWLYLWGAFFVGLGLGWWLFAGRGSAARSPNSAEEARKRARPTPIDAPAPDAEPTPTPGVMQAIPSEVLVSLRHQLDMAREARQEAEALASRLDEQRRAALARESDARGRQETLAARLDKARGDRDSLRAEVEAARRTIRRLEDDAALDLPTAQLDAEAPPEPPSRLRPSPSRLPPSDANLSIPSPSDPRSLGATARVTAGASAPSAARRRPKKRGPVEVLFGPLSTVPVTPSVRSIPFELTARLKADAPRDTRIDDLHIFLRFDLEDEGIALNGRRRGPLTLYRDSGLEHGQPVVVQVAVSTGFHSDTPTAARPPAIVGAHRVVIKIEYRVRGEEESIAARFAAAIPVVEDAS